MQSKDAKKKKYSWATLIVISLTLIALLTLWLRAYNIKCITLEFCPFSALFMSCLENLRINIITTSFHDTWRLLALWVWERNLFELQLHNHHLLMSLSYTVLHIPSIGFLWALQFHSSRRVYKLVYRPVFHALGSESTATLTRIRTLLKMNEWMKI